MGFYGLQPFQFGAVRGVGSSYDADAAAYFARIVTAGSTISAANMAAVDAFVVGCKADGVWTPIKSCCLLAGPDTLAGALAPLMGSAPTNNGFVSGDYSRTTGLVGDLTKYLDSNYNNATAPQNSRHLSTWVTAVDTGTGNRYLLGTGGSANGESVIGYTVGSPGNYLFRSSTSSSVTDGTASRATGFHGISRSVSTQVDCVLPGFTTPKTLTSQAPRSVNIKVFGRDTGTYWNGRISVYTAGETINLSLLSSRISTYMSALT